ncbi:MAG: PQQ-binding-like beta-propeller repeat protein [Gemmataceae bacterium]|nr:PQQ-binding-like beta-propeller repeat protein [Gemmataceae bacterium]
MKRHLALVVCVIGCVAPAWSQEPSQVKEDEKTLKAAGLPNDGPALLDYLRKRTIKEADGKQVESLIRDLGDEEFKVREKAYGQLMAIGTAGLIRVKAAESDNDPEIRARAKDLREKIEAKAEPAIQAATARLIADRNPPGAAEVLLAYMPYAADQYVIDEIGKTLGKVGVQNGNADKSLVAALKDPLPIRRAIAAEALVKGKAKEHFGEARNLLKDAEALVRLRTGLAFVELREKEALPVLIETLKHLNPEQLWPVEEILVRLAGDAVPSISLGNNEVSRKAAFDAWNEWFGKHQTKIDLATLDKVDAMLNYTLVIQQNVIRIVNGQRVPAIGEVYELDGAKNKRWSFSVPTYPVAAEVVGPDRVLIAEYQGGKISERDTKGNVIWEKAVGGNPIGVQRLPNGHTFVVTQNKLMEFDGARNEVFSHQRPNHDVFRARKLRNGEFVFVTNSGQFVRMDAKGQRVIKTFNVSPIPVLFGNLDVLPNGGVVVPDFQQNRVVEYDADGKQVSSFNVQSPNSVMRLPNGNTLVASQNTRKVSEFDRTGREVWTINTEGMVFSARRR